MSSVKRVRGSDAVFHCIYVRESYLHLPLNLHIKSFWNISIRSCHYPEPLPLIKMADLPVSIRLAQAIGLTTSSALAGSSLTISAMLVPRLLESPSPLLLKQWKHAFEAGRASIPPLASICSLCFGYLAYEAKHAPNMLPHVWKIYTASALLCIGIAPFTLTAMASTNNKLLNKAEETSALKAEDKIVEVGLGGETAHQLLDKWATLNLGRAIMLATAAVLSTWATLR